MQKTIHFRQIQWFGAQSNLPSLLNTTLTQRPNIENTIYQQYGETFEVRHRQSSPTEVRLHLASCIQGARKPITPRARGIPAADLGEATPPANSEFTEREIALVIRRRTLGYTATGTTTHSKRVEGAVRGLLALGHSTDVANRLNLSARADAEMVAELMKRGVDRLDFDLTLPAADADDVIEGQPRSLPESIGRAVRQEIVTRITTDHEDEEIDALEEMSARLHLQLRKRAPTVEQIENLTAIAASAIESDEEFKIRTVDGTVFTREKLLLQSSFNHPNSTTLSYSVSWAAIATFLDEIG
jgi:hypothetical protein